MFNHLAPGQQPMEYACNETTRIWRTGWGLGRSCRIGRKAVKMGTGRSVHSHAGGRVRSLLEGTE